MQAGRLNKDHPPRSAQGQPAGRYSAENASLLRRHTMAGRRTALLVMP